MSEIMLSGRRSPAGGAGMFVGEVSSAEFITGNALASQIGLTAGTSQHSDAGWLHFEDTVDGQTKYISKKSLRHSISWDQLNAVGAVFGTATVVIKGLTYKVRLLSGANSNPATTVNNSYDHPGTWGSEWNRLMYRISAKPFGNVRNTLASEGIATGDWASYSEADLLTRYSHGNGSYQWCQETGTTATTRVNRGSNGVSRSVQFTSSVVTSNFGWRAVLELIP